MNLQFRPLHEIMRMLICAAPIVLLRSLLFVAVWVGHGRERALRMWPDTDPRTER